MSIAVLRVSTALIRERLRLPEDCDIIGSSKSDDHRVAEFLVEHSSIPDDAIVVAAVFQKKHGVTFFDHFEVKQEKLAKLVVDGVTVKEMTVAEAESLVALFELTNLARRP